MIFIATKVDFKRLFVRAKIATAENAVYSGLGASNGSSAEVPRVVTVKEQQEEQNDSLKDKKVIIELNNLTKGT